MSGDASAVLALPYILPSQAQKHVTHNEALRLLDVLVQPAVASRSVTAPPPGAAPGARHIVPAGATGAFAGQEGRIAFLDESGWDFLVPRPGWAVRVLDEGVEVVFDGSAWTGPAESLARFAGLGIATPADAVNRLAVAGPATLLTHAGAGHRLKINKAGAGDTASLLFQTGWSGRAEMGTTGGDDFEIRTSADGTSFQTALRAAGDGRVGLPAGAAVAPGNAAAPGLAFEGDADTGLFRPAADVLALAAGGAERARIGAAGFEVAGPLTGTAVMQSAADATPGRLMPVGAFGLGDPGNAGTLLTAAGAANALRGWRIDRVAAAHVATVGGPAGAEGGTFMTIGHGAGAQAQVYYEAGGPGRIWQRALVAGNWSGWRLIYSQGSVLGTVTQSGGVPTGAVIEAGGNANGRYTRFADGTQICTRRLTVKPAADATSGNKSAPWTFPAAFSGFLDLGVSGILNTSAPNVRLGPTVSGVLATGCTIHYYEPGIVGQDIYCYVTATGRWF